MDAATNHDTVKMNHTRLGIRMLALVIWYHDRNLVIICHYKKTLKSFKASVYYLLIVNGRM